jgi:flagellar motor switch protein FliG
MTGDVQPLAAPTPASISGATAAAILLMLLDERDAAAVLQHFEPVEVKTLASAMFAASSASESDVERALDLFVGESKTIAALAVRAETRIRGVIHAAIGHVRADNILSAIAPQSSAATLDLLRWMEIPAMAGLLASEHPQVGAIILSVLTPESAALALEGLDEDLQSDLLYRAARLSAVSADAIADLEAILTQTSTTKANKPDIRMGGKSNAAKIVNSMKKQGGQRVLRAVKKKDKQLGSAIEDEMFVFDNLMTLDGKALGAVMRAVDANDVALALKGASDVLADKMLASMSARAAQSIRDDMADLGPAKRVDVEEAQKAVLAVARKLAADGTITLGDQGDDYV